MTTKIAVIGGGVSGLSVAAQLYRFRRDGSVSQDIDVTLFEASDRLGGVIQTQRVGQWVIDLGPDMFATKPDTAVNLINSLGGSDHLIQPRPNRRGARICRGGKLVPVPNGFVLMRATRILSMWSTPLLSWRGKLRFFAERFIAPRPQPVETTDASTFARTGVDGVDDESVASFARRRLGSEVLDRIVAPLAAGIYTADVEKLSMRSTMNPFWSMEQTYGSLAAATRARKRSGQDSTERFSTGARYGQFRSFRGGMSDLVDVLASSLPESSVCTSVDIQSIQRDVQSGRWTLTDQHDRQTTFDQVVIALPPRAAGRLLQPVAPSATQAMARIPTASAAIVILVVRRDLVRKDIETFGFVVPPAECRRILAGSFANHKFDGRASDDHVILRVFVGGAMQPELLDRDDAFLTEMVIQELRQVIGLDGKPDWSTVVRWNDAMPQYHVGHHHLAQQIQSSVDRVPGLSIISNAIHGVGIAPLVAQAETVAKKIFDQLPKLASDRKANSPAAAPEHQKR